MLNLNTLLFTFINNGAGYYRTLDWVFIGVTSYILYTVFFVVLFYVAVYVPFRIPKGMLRTQSIYRAIEMIIGIGGTFVLVKIIKVIAAVPRPFEVLQSATVLAPEGGASFPSGHASLMMALATAIYFYYPRLGKYLFVFAFVVALSRVFVGVHYPLDVAVGLLLGYVVPKCIHTLFMFVKIAPNAKKD